MATRTVVFPTRQMGTLRQKKKVLLFHLGVTNCQHNTWLWIDGWMNEYMFSVQLHKTFDSQFHIPCILFSEWLYSIDFLKCHYRIKTASDFFPHWVPRGDSQSTWTALTHRRKPKYASSFQSLVFYCFQSAAKSLRCQCCVELVHLNPYPTYHLVLWLLWKCGWMCGFLVGM